MTVFHRGRGLFVRSHTNPVDSETCNYKHQNLGFSQPSKQCLLASSGDSVTNKTPTFRRLFLFMSPEIYDAKIEIICCTKYTESRTRSRCDIFLLIIRPVYEVVARTAV
jgi:hypothetical protein